MDIKNKTMLELDENCQWLCKSDMEEFARFLFVYKNDISPFWGKFNWASEDFKYFCKENNITAKGRSDKKVQYNHFWFYASKPEYTDNDYAAHFFRHIRNAFAHCNIECCKEGRKHQKFYIINDYNGDVKTMSGKIRSDLFWKMIKLLYNTKSK